MQIADIRYNSKEAFAGSALHILHRGTNYIVYIATAQETCLKLLLNAYDVGKQAYTCQEDAYSPASAASRGLLLICAGKLTPMLTDVVLSTFITSVELICSWLIRICT